MNFHIVYNSFETQGRDYIGKHSTSNPYDEYLGSFSDPSFQPEQKIVIAYANSIEGAVWLERMFQKVFNVVEDEQYVNKSFQTSTKFHYDWTGRRRSDQNRENVSKGLKGKPKSEEHKAKLRKPKSEQHRRNVALSRAGMKLSPEHCEAIRRGNTGKKRSSEFKQQQSERMLGVNTWTTGAKWYHNENGETRRFREPPPEGWKPGRKP